MKFVVGIFSILAVLVMASAAQALETPSVVIGHIQAGGVGSSDQELVSIYNNSDESVDITGWCLTNKETTSDMFAPFACFQPDDPRIKMVLPPERYAVAVSSGYMEANPEAGQAVYDVVFEPAGVYGSITAGSDTIGLYDADETAIDEVVWASSLSAGKVLQRKTSTDDPTHLNDTDSLVWSDDFTKVTGPVTVLSGVVYESQAVDVCGNLPLEQEELPPGYGYDEAGNCELLETDLCINLPDIQTGVPSGYLSDEAGACRQDVCLNIAELQLIVPPGYGAVDDECTRLESRELRITEVLPNVTGVDTGKEFIEFYNPHDSAVELAGYVLLAGKDLEKTVPLPAFTLLPKSYRSFSDIELGLTLLNTTNRLALIAPAGNIVSETAYADAPEDESWASLDEGWHYTDQVTPGAANTPSYIEEEETEAQAATAVLSACAAGKYRHPVTNRCRNIERDAAMLVACGADEYRNPETNRCRKTAVLGTALTPCRAGYERNAETNRCRKVTLAATSLKPCQQGYERNPLTNRCRKSSSAASGGVITATASGADTNEGAITAFHLGNALFATAGIGAVGYGVYEWRQEIGNGLRRAGRIFTRK